MTTDYDIILVQEHWLFPDELAYMSNLSCNFTSFSVTPMTIEDKLHRGRPYGGVGIMWNKSLSHCVEIVKYDDDRILGLQLKTNGCMFLFLCVYLPYDCDKFYDDYCFYLDKIRCIIDAASTPYIFVLGDFNANLKSESVFGSELIEFCDVNNLCLIDKSMLLPDSFTYFSEAHGSTSWLDHCMTTESGKSLISDISIENTFICSDHFPLCVNIACDISPISTTCNVVDNKTYNMPKWNQVCNSDKCKYESCTLKLSRDIVIPSEALLCRDAKCKVHRNDIDCFYKSIMSSLKQATNECIPSSINSTKKFIPVPGWNDYVKEQHYNARHAFK